MRAQLQHQHAIVEIYADEAQDRQRVRDELRFCLGAGSDDLSAEEAVASGSKDEIRKLFREPLHTLTAQLIQADTTFLDAMVDQLKATGSLESLDPPSGSHHLKMLCPSPGLKKLQRWARKKGWLYFRHQFIHGQSYLGVLEQALAQVKETYERARDRIGRQMALLY